MPGTMGKQLGLQLVGLICRTSSTLALVNCILHVLSFCAHGIQLLCVTVEGVLGQGVPKCRIGRFFPSGLRRSNAITFYS